MAEAVAQLSLRLYDCATSKLKKSIFTAIGELSQPGGVFSQPSLEDLEAGIGKRDAHLLTYATPSSQETGRSCVERVSCKRA